MEHATVSSNGWNGRVEFYGVELDEVFGEKHNISMLGLEIFSTDFEGCKDFINEMIDKYAEDVNACNWEIVSPNGYTKYNGYNYVPDEKDLE